MSDSTGHTVIDPRVLRDCCGRFATGVTVVTTRTDEGDHGMTASAFMSVSLDPPLVCISVKNTSKMLAKVKSSGKYAVSILTGAMDRHALHFAGRPDAQLTNLFEERSGLPVLRGAVAVIVTDLVQQVEAGDHVLLIGHVRNLEFDRNGEPLLYHAGRFGSLVEQDAA